MVNDAAEFLLELSYPNLYDRTNVDFILRCRYCGAEVERWRSQAHHEGHKRFVQRRKQLAREQALEKARAARKANAIPLPFLNRGN